MPQYRKVPLHIISESYGGKMAAEFALAITKAQAAGSLDVDFRCGAHVNAKTAATLGSLPSHIGCSLLILHGNAKCRHATRPPMATLCWSRQQSMLFWMYRWTPVFYPICTDKYVSPTKPHLIYCTRRSVSLGDSWISPVDYVLAWAPFLKAWSLLEDDALADVSNLALRTQQAVGNGNLTGATALWAEVEGTVSKLTDKVVCAAGGSNYDVCRAWHAQTMP